MYVYTHIYNICIGIFSIHAYHDITYIYIYIYVYIYHIYIPVNSDLWPSSTSRTIPGLEPCCQDLLRDLGEIADGPGAGKLLSCCWFRLILWYLRYIYMIYYDILYVVSSVFAWYKRLISTIEVVGSNFHFEATWILPHLTVGPADGLFELCAEMIGPKQKKKGAKKALPPKQALPDFM